MRCNLRQWEQALPLAVELGGPSAVRVKIEYAKLLEKRGERRHALAQYENLLKEGLSGKQLYVVEAAIARTSIHCGDPWKGRQMANKCADPALYSECAHIFESMKLFEDAGDFFKLGGHLEKAVACYISIRNFSKAFPLLECLSSPKHYVEYAKAMEETGNWAEALVAYELAQVICLKSQEAKELAEQHDMMDVYTELVVDVTSKDECLQLARYYESMGEYCKAGSLLERCGQIERALKLYLCWGSKGGIEQAIGLVGREKTDILTSQLFDYLNKEKHSGEGNLLHFYMLHKALGNNDEAAKLVSVLAADEQEKGNYKRAHQLLLDFSLVLKTQRQAIPTNILLQLMLLHSYVLGKIHILLGDHSSAARLLIRVACSITKFPAHVVPILTSTAIECHRAGLKSTAFKFASMLMCPEYRNSISSGYKRKVEKIVRKCEKVEEKEPLTPCPVCSSLLPNMELHCNKCDNNIPFCIASGRHMILGDWSICPHCNFPALATEFMKVVESDSICPMCSEKVSVADIVCIDDPFVLGNFDCANKVS